MTGPRLATLLAALLLAALLLATGLIGLTTGALPAAASESFALGAGVFFLVAVGKLFTLAAQAPPSFQAVARKSKAKPALWELEDVYMTLVIQIRSHEREVAAGHEAGRCWLDDQGEVQDREFGLLENTLEDLRFARRQVVTAYVKAGGDLPALQSRERHLAETFAPAVS